MTSVSTATTPHDSFTKNYAHSMRTENDRLGSFVGWPCAFLDPRSLAKAGFFYTRKEDVVKCAYCRVEIGKWEPGDDIMTDHKRWSPNCPFIKTLACENMSSESSSASSEGEDTCGVYGIEIRPNSVPENEACTSRANLQKLGIQKNRGPTYGSYAIYETRLLSFSEWPRSMKQKPCELAAAGFFYTGKGDQTLCFHCGGGLKDWEDDDNPWEQHALWFPRCNFLILQKSREFVEEVANRKKTAKKSETNASSSQQEVMNVAEAVTNNASTKVSTKLEAETKEHSDECNEKNPSTLCKICFSKEVGVVFLPCGHVVACVDCAPALSTCAVCRKKLEATVRAFLS